VCPIVTVSPSTDCTLALVSIASVLRLISRTFFNSADHDRRRSTASTWPSLGGSAGAGGAGGTAGSGSFGFTAGFSAGFAFSGSAARDGRS
jgi:hypothetical protein